MNYRGAKEISLYILEYQIRQFVYQRSSKASRHSVCVWAMLFTSWHRRCGDGEGAGVEEPGVVGRDLLALLETHARQLGQAASVGDHGVVAHLGRDS